MAALVAGGFVLSSLFRDNVVRAFDAQLNVYLVALIAESEVLPDGKLSVNTALGDPRFEQIFSGWYWQIDGERGVGAPFGPDLRSPSLWDEILSFDEELSRTETARGYVQGPDAQELRFLASTISLPGSGLPFRFIVAGDSAEIDAENSRFDTMLSWSFGILAMGLLVALLFIVQLGLLPLARVSDAMADIRSGRAARLDGEFPSEIQPLADELNGLVEHNAALLERARTHVGNLAHALKTPLSILTTEAQVRPEELASTVMRQSEIMRSQIDHHLTRARTAAAARLLGSRAEVQPILNDLARTLEKINHEKGVSVRVRCDGDVAFRGEQEDLEEMVGNLMDNACKWAKGNVEVEARVASAGTNRLLISIGDDGPGLPEESREAVVRRGAKLDESVPGSGLGLSIVVDIGDLYGGVLTLEESRLGGLKATLALPMAEG
jgi:signal transduction histidine kinase